MTCFYTGCCCLTTSNFSAIRSITLGLAQFVTLSVITIYCGADGFSIFLPCILIAKEQFPKLLPSLVPNSVVSCQYFLIQHNLK